MKLTIYDLVLIPCDTPKPIENGYMTVSGHMPFDMVTYTCDDGYHTANGNSTRQCLQTGNWSGFPAICESK